MPTWNRPLHTNGIPTCPWADGVDWPPAMLSSPDGAFRADRPGTTLRTLAIDGARVECVPAGKRGQLVCVGDKSDLVARLFRRHGVPPNVVVLTDAGHASKEGHSDVPESLGFAGHDLYPPAVHHDPSPGHTTPNRTAKRAPREIDLGWTDDVAASLALARPLHGHQGGAGECSTRTLQLHLRGPSMARVHERVLPGETDPSAFHAHCHRAYHIWKTHGP